MSRRVKSNIRPLDLNDLRARIAGYEARYSAPSDRLYEVFTVCGVLQETPDFLDWSSLYETWQDVAARCRA